MKQIKRNDFNQNVLLNMKPNLKVLVLCDTEREQKTVEQMCYITRKRHPRNDVSRYTTLKVLGNNLVVTAKP